MASPPRGRCLKDKEGLYYHYEKNNNYNARNALKQ